MINQTTEIRKAESKPDNWDPETLGIIIQSILYRSKNRGEDEKFIQPKIIGQLTRPENIDFTFKYVTGKPLVKVEKDLLTEKLERDYNANLELTSDSPKPVVSRNIAYMNIEDINLIFPDFIESFIESLQLDSKIQNGLTQILLKTNHGNKQDLMTGEQTLINVLRENILPEAKNFIRLYSIKKELMPEKFTQEHQVQLEFYQHQQDTIPEIVNLLESLE
jgi:hypothetical protein